MLERIRAGHFATLFSEGPEPEEPQPPQRQPTQSGLPERVRRLAGRLPRRAPAEPFQARERAAT